jgi:GTP-binding protein
MLEEEETPPEEKPPDALIGTVAIVGFPNVGKSTLVNRLSGTRAAVVHETPGVTRDRKELLCEWNGKRFLLIDTGGVDIADPTPITRSIADQAREAVEEADLALLVVDARAGITPGDEEVGQILRESHKPVLVLANKIDDPKQDSLSYDLHRLGLGDPIPVSGLHGTGVGDLLDSIVEELEEHGSSSGRPELPADAIRVAILGRPNVGKSSLLNALLGRERVIVSEIPGTTRDSIDTVLERGDRTFVLVDTAGLRRKRRHRQGIEYYSELRALEAAERADVALVLIDAEQGVVDQDLAVADISRKAECSTLVVLSKWDVSTVRIEDVRGHLRRRLRQRPAFLAVSAQTGRGLNRLLDSVAELFDRHTARVPTGELNRVLGELREARQPPSRKGKSLNLLYGAQIRVRPPRFRFFVNDPTLVTRDYGYWVENELRERFGMDGVPVSIDFVKRS